MSSRESTRHSDAGTKPSWRLVSSVGAGILVMCAIAAGVGVHAALGDGDGPAVQLANRGVDLRPDAERGVGGDAGDGTAAGGPPESEAPAPPSSGPVPPSTPPTAGPAPSVPPSAPPTSPPSTTPPGPTNPYLDPADPRYVSEADRTAWLEGQQRVRQCMAAAGQPYLDWEWWQGGSPMPTGLDEAAQTSWQLALQGDESNAGCAVEAGGAPTPPPGAGGPEGATPPPAAPGPGEQQLVPPSAAPEALPTQAVTPGSESPEASDSPEV